MTMMQFLMYHLNVYILLLRQSEAQQILLHCRKSCNPGFHTQNQGRQVKKIVNKVDNIFEGDFYDMQEDVDEVEDFIKENGEDLM